MVKLNAWFIESEQGKHSFPDAFVRKDVVYGYDIVTFEGLQADAILFRSNQCNKNKKAILMFQCDFGRNQVKYARIIITHVFFIAIVMCRVHMFFYAF